jgi:hypothetical protein
MASDRSGGPFADKEGLGVVEEPHRPDVGKPGTQWRFEPGPVERLELSDSAEEADAALVVERSGYGGSPR